MTSTHDSTTNKQATHIWGRHIWLDNKWHIRSTHMTGQQTNDTHTSLTHMIGQQTNKTHTHAPTRPHTHTLSFFLLCSLSTPFPTHTGSESTSKVQCWFCIPTQDSKPSHSRCRSVHHRIQGYRTPTGAHDTCDWSPKPVTEYDDT